MVPPKYFPDASGVVETPEGKSELSLFWVVIELVEVRSEEAQNCC
jgi:hypothetical protein